MTDKPGGFLNGLRQIEEAVNYCGLVAGHREKFNQALAFLRTLLEGDAGEDAELMNNYILEVTEESPLCRKVMLTLLSRLSAKAKLGEAEIRKAKREVLEEIHKIATGCREWTTALEIAARLDELTALDKEAGK